MDYKSLKQDIKQIYKVQIPQSILFLLDRMTHIINLIYMGWIESSAAKMGALSLGNSILIILIVSFMVGISNKNTSELSQAYSLGYINLCSDLLNKARIFALLIVVFNYTLIILFIKDLLTLINIDSELIQYTYLYLVYYIFGILFTIIYNATRIVLMAGLKQEKLYYVSVTSCILHLLWTYIFIYQLRYGVVGAAISSSLTQFCNCAIVSIIIYLDKDLREINKFPSRENFIGLKTFMKQTISTILLRLTDAWSIALISFLACIFSTISSASAGVLTSIYVVQNLFLVGINASQFIILSTYIIKKDLKKTKFFSTFFVLQGEFYTLIVITILLIFNYKIVSLFTNLEDVRLYTYEIIKWVIPVYYLAYTVKFLQTAQFVVYKKAQIGAICSLFVYLIGYPFGIYFAFFKGLEVKGLYMGLIIGNVIIVGIQVYYLKFKLNIQQCIEQSSSKMNQLKIDIDQTSEKSSEFKKYYQQPIKENLIKKN